MGTAGSRGRFEGTHPALAVGDSAVWARLATLWRSDRVAFLMLPLMGQAVERYVDDMSIADITNNSSVAVGNYAPQPQPLKLPR